MMIKAFPLLSSLLLSLLFVNSTLGQNWPGIPDSIYSDILKEQRKIQVILPKEYNTDPGKKFEVLYVLDGEWYMEHIPFIYNFTTSSGYTPPNIFVLLPNTYVNKKNLRDRDFSPTKIGNDTLLGGADKFHDFLKNELISYIENKYRASGKRSLVGSSFSGLFSVYAFVKDPGLFQSFVASDPNLNWDQNYVSKLAAEKLPHFSGINSTLFIAGLTNSFAGMGIAAMDSVLKMKAPASIPWKCIAYENETHYSVQHKAFYDGFRFSHLGYSATGPEYHPQSGILEAGKPLKVLVIKEIPGSRFTTDGQEPSLESPLFARGQVSLTAPANLKIKNFSNRPEHTKVVGGMFAAGPAIAPGKISKSSKAGLNYSIYEGDWDKFPSLEKLKPHHAGKLTEGFNINSIDVKKNAAYLIEGYLEVPEDGYFIFYASSDNGARAMLGDRQLFESNGSDSKLQSFVAPLKKGLHPLRIEFFKMKDAGEIHFIIGRTTSSNDRWWETQVFRL